jgi:uncharacterized protein YgbK (DUF1537 family)
MIAEAISRRHPDLDVKLGSVRNAIRKNKLLFPDPGCFVSPYRLNSRSSPPKWISTAANKACNWLSEVAFTMGAVMLG